MKERVKSLTDGYISQNGMVIPSLGFGTYRMKGKEAEESVRKALDVGYRLIDTASVYRNEAEVGKAIRESGVPRSEVLLTTKVWNADQGYNSTKKAFKESLERLGLDYIDIYLIHWPIVGEREELWVELNRQTWKAMEEFYHEGLVKAIGLSNFNPHHIESLLEVATVKPIMNQIELYPGWMREEVVDYCHKQDIIVEAWGPISRGKLFEFDVIQELSKKHGRTPAQIVLRWHLQRDQLPIPKSSNPERMVENTKIFDFELSDEDMSKISAITEVTGTGRNPDDVADI